MQLENTIYYHDVELELMYQFKPAEEDTYDYQGCDAVADIIEVNVGCVDIIGILNQDQLEEIEQLLIFEHSIGRL